MGSRAFEQPSPRRIGLPRASGVAPGLVAALAGVALLAAAVLIWLSLGLHVVVLIGSASSWWIGTGAVVAAELLTAGSVVLRLRGPRSAWAATGMALFVAAGLTFVVGVVGDVATFTPVAASCHGSPQVVAKESSPLLQSRGSLFTRHGLLLVGVAGSAYEPSLGDEPVADGRFTATCRSTGDVVVAFPGEQYGPSLAPLTVKGR